MPSSGHEPPPADPRCDCGGCREFRAITLNPRREPDRNARRKKRNADRKQQREMEERRIDADLPPDSPGFSTGCAETGAGKGQSRSTECA